MRNRIDIDLRWNIATQNILHYLNEEESKSNKNGKEKAASRSTIQLELKAPLVFAQFISLLPIYGVSEEDYRKLRFEWKSWKGFYSMSVIAINVTFYITYIFAINQYIKGGKAAFKSLDRLPGDMIFLTSSLLISISFLILARQWKDLIGEWAELQSEMNHFDSSTVPKKIRLLTICLIFSSIFEHLLANTQFSLATDAGPDRLRIFLEDENITSVVGYHLWLAILVYCGNLLLTLIWNYTDIFLIAISLSLANMFKQFNKELRMTATKVSTENAFFYWKKKRELYNKLSLLAKSVEDKTSRLVLISFSVNLFFMCIQLLNSIKPLMSLVRVAYFCGSFGHILFRTCSVCFSATSIYEHSRASLPTLFSVPSEHFNNEVKRLTNQVTSEILALSGCKFFAVTRSLMLTIAGTVVTYEVILVQFSTMPEDDVLLTNNSSLGV